MSSLSPEVPAESSELKDLRYLPARRDISRTNKERNDRTGMRLLHVTAQDKLHTVSCVECGHTTAHNHTDLDLETGTSFL